MNISCAKMISRTLVAAACTVLCAQIAVSQGKCLSDDDVKAMIVQLGSASRVSFNEKLRDRLLKISEKEQERFQNSLAEEREKTGALAQEAKTSRKDNTAKLCSVLKEFGWPTVDLLGQDGFDAAFTLLKNSSFELQRELLPVVIAATKKGEIARRDFAGYIDRLRLSAGLKQLFGTEATIANGFLVLYPIDAESEVDSRREQYGLPPLRDYIRTLEQIYKLPLIKSPDAIKTKSGGTPDPALNSMRSTLFADQPTDDVIRMDINLVNLNVSVYSDRQKSFVSSLEQQDFTVFEDEHEQTVSFFANTDVPFDLVLLLDLSGSTSAKRELIRKTTRHFIELARPSDRVAIVSFSDMTHVIVPLVGDRKKLLDNISNIEGTGRSNVWQALDFTLKQIVGAKTTARRRAVVLMSDGADSQLIGFGRGIEFSDLLEAIRQSEALVIPIYLDTEGHDPLSKRVYRTARDTLAMLAEVSGGLYYKARRIEDLNGVYPQVIADLGKVYSLGYKPTNGVRDGSWRRVQVQIRNRPDLIVRTKRGYYAS
jgi:VWFA-related protein